MKLSWIVLIILLINQLVIGQDSNTKNRKQFVSIQTGFDRRLVQDEIISPLIYRGITIPIILTYQHISNKNSHSVSIFYDQLKLHSSISVKEPAEAYYTRNYNGLIEYSYCRKLYTFTEPKIEIFAGVDIKSFLNFRDHYYSNYTHYTTGELINSVGISTLFLKKFDNTKEDFASFQIKIPLLNYDMLNYLYNVNVAKELNTEAELNNSKNLVKSSKLVTVNKHFEIHTDLTYNKFISERIGIKFNYQFQFYKTEKFENLFDVICVNYQFMTGLIIKL